MDSWTLPRRTPPPAFDHLASVFTKLADIFDPPLRLTVSETAAQFRYVNNPGSYVGDWQNAEVPYMVEPADTLSSRLFTTTIFVGPAQCGKTDALILNWFLYMAIVEAGDMAVFQPTMAVAKDFSVRRLSRMLRHSKAFGERQLPGASADNLFEKHFDNGSMLSLGWPAVSQFAGRPLMRCALTDYDRMPDDVDGEGSPYDLAQKRNTTFGSFGMTLVESSPSREVTNTRWIASSLHEAPPCEGILALYNRGDRRRYYWPCPACDQFFEGRFEHLEWDPAETASDSAATVRLVCPHCAHPIRFGDRDAMFERAVWLKDGQAVDHGKVIGEGRRSSIASFWLNGIAARFTTWARLVETFIDADHEFDQTGSEEALKKFHNTDLGQPYIPKRMMSQRLPEVIKARAEPMAEREVPANVRFLVGQVDVQANRFECQVLGVLPGQPFDLVVVDRFPVIKSMRSDADDDRLWVKPATYQEDWDVLIEGMLKKSYPLSDGSGRRMQIKGVACDSAGKDGATTNAYAFYRRLRTAGLAGRFTLVRGDHSPLGKLVMPRTRIGYPDASKRDKLSGARGDVPVLFFNSDMLKDDVAGRLDNTEPGKGMIRFPDWLPDAYYAELCAEVRSEKGGWDNPGRHRNEAWDLLYYGLGYLVSSYILAEKMDWSNPPGWAAPWDKNDLVTQEGKERFANGRQSGYDFRALGRQLAGADGD